MELVRVPPTMVSNAAAAAAAAAAAPTAAVAEATPWLVSAGVPLPAL